MELGNKTICSWQKYSSTNTHNGHFTGIISVLETNKLAKCLGGAERERKTATSRQMPVEASLPLEGRDSKKSVLAI